MKSKKHPTEALTIQLQIKINQYFDFIKQIYRFTIKSQ
jgi:hypothetical protein